MGKTRIKLTLAEEIWTTWRKTANGRTPDAQISEGLERMVEDDETRWGAKDKVHGLRRQRGLDHPLRKPTTTMQKLRIDEVLLHKAADALSRTETTGVPAVEGASIREVIAACILEDVRRQDTYESGGVEATGTLFPQDWQVRTSGEKEGKQEKGKVNYPKWMLTATIIGVVMMMMMIALEVAGQPAEREEGGAESTDEWWTGLTEPMGECEQDSTQALAIQTLMEYHCCPTKCEGKRT